MKTWKCVVKDSGKDGKHANSLKSYYAWRTCGTGSCFFSVSKKSQTFSRSSPSERVVYVYRKKKPVPQGIWAQHDLKLFACLPALRPLNN